MALLPTTRRRLSTTLLALMCCIPIFGATKEFTVGEITYATRNDKEVRVKTITKPEGGLTDTLRVDIPEKVTNDGVEYAVTAIGDANSGSVIKEPGSGYEYHTIIRIPGTVADLYPGTFKGDYRWLDLIFLPNNNIKQWSEGMFRDSYFHSLILPEGVWTDIPKNFCRNTQFWDTVTLPSNCRHIGDYAFAMDDSTNSIYTIPKFNFNYGLETIGEKAFYNTSPITGIDYREGKVLELPGTVTSIGESSFEKMGDIYGVFLPSSLKVIPKRAFANWKRARTLSIPEGVERIEAEAFLNNGGEEYKFPYGYTYHGVYNYFLPSTIKFVGKDAFTNSCQLISVNIPSITPPKTEGQVIAESGISLMVPKKGYYDYCSDTNWKKFNVEISHESSTLVLACTNDKYGGSAEGSGQYKEGQIATVSANPSQGYKFVGWLNNGGQLVSTDTNYNFVTVGEKMQLIAVFLPKDGKTGNRPDVLYSRLTLTPDESPYIYMGDITLRRGLERDTEWDIDLKPEYNDIFNEYSARINADFVHAHPDKYDTYEVYQLSDKGLYLGYNKSTQNYYTHSGCQLPDDIKKFALESEYNDDRILIPSCTFRMHLPIINRVTNEKDTIDYTVDILMAPASKPELTHDLYSSEGGLIYGDQYGASSFIGSLDTKNGFDAELSISAKSLTDGKTTVINSVKRSYGPGEITPDKEAELRDQGIYWSSNSRYVVAEMLIYGNLSGNNNYIFNLRARNYNDDGTPGEWIQQTVGKANREVNPKDMNIEAQIVWDNRVYLQDNEITYIDNKKYADQYTAIYESPTGDYSSMLNANRINMHINKYPQWWGNCEVMVEDPTDNSSNVLIYTFEPNKSKWSASLIIQCPLDGEKHRITLRWPDIDLERNVIFTDYFPKNFPKYRFNVYLRGGGIENIEDLYMVYQTDDGEINKKIIKSEEWHTGSKYDPKQTFLLEETRNITRIITLTDTVPEGTQHSVTIPGSLDKVYSFRSWFNDTERMGLIDNISSAQIGENNLYLYGVADVYLKLVDASTGETIRTGISAENVENATLEPNGLLKIRLYQDADKYLNSDLSGNSRPILLADNYIPYYLMTGIKISGHKVSADGYTGYADQDGKVVISIPMRRRVLETKKRPFDIMNVYYRTPGVEEVKEKYRDNELEWQSAFYSGAKTRIAYEGGFRPVYSNKIIEANTVAFTVVYYDTEYDWKYLNTFDDNLNLLVDINNKYGPLSYVVLRSGNDNKKVAVYPKSDSYPKWGKDYYKYDIIAKEWVIGCDSYRDKNNYRYVHHIHDPNHKYTIVTYEFSPKQFIQPEDEAKVYISLKSGDEILLGTFKNLTENAMYMAKDAETEAPLGEEHIAELANMQDLERFNDAYRKFKIDMPKDNESFGGLDDFELDLPTDVVLPFNIGVQKINNDYVIRGVMSYNFLPGGTAVDIMDKVNFAADMDNVFYNIQRAMTHDKTEYSRDERALQGAPSYFAGVRGWLEARFVKNINGLYVPKASGMGVKVEASGNANSTIGTPLFRAGLVLSGETSTYVALEYPSEQDLQWGVDANSKFLHDVVQHTTVSLTTGFNVGAGIDIYIARAMCGVTGTLTASFDSEIRYKPYLQNARKLFRDPNVTDKPAVIPKSYTYSGSRMAVSGKLKAYAEAKFLFWSVRTEITLASFNKRWYDPDNMLNPLKQRDEDEEENGNGKQFRTLLRSSVYKPLKMSFAPENTNIILRDIDTYAEPRYLFGGTDMAYYKINANNMSDSHIMFKGGNSLNSTGEPVVTADVSSTENKGIIAYEVSTAPADKMTDMEIAPKYMGIKASVYNGSSWSTPTLLTGQFEANYTPRTAIDENGKAALAWKGGEYQASDYAQNAGSVVGSLYLKNYNGTTWSDPVQITSTVPGKSISDYTMAMLDGKPYMLATFGTESTTTRETKNTLGSIGYNADGEPYFVTSTFDNVSNPQLINFNGKLYGAAIVAKDKDNNGNTIKATSDIHLYNVSSDGIIEDLGGLGLNERNIMDFRLVKSDKAAALIWREATQVVNETDNTLTITPSVYAALLRYDKNSDGVESYFLSCPQLIAKADNGLDISFYDAYLPDESSVTGAVTLYNNETGGANVVESTNYFDNDFTIQHAGIDTQVERGADYGYYVVVFNEGKDMIDYVDMQLGEDATPRTFNVSIKPGASEVLSDLVLYSTDLETGIKPIITPHFNESPLTARTYAQARSATLKAKKLNRRRLNKNIKASEANPEIQLRVVDMSVTPLTTFIEGSDNEYTAATDTVINVNDDIKDFIKNVPQKHTTVLLNVINDSPISLKSNYTTNVGLYYDINGLKPYEYAHDVEIPASKFEDEENVVVARILVGKVPESVMLYAVAHTVDTDGNVIKDQNMTNNASPIYLEKNDLTDVPSDFDSVTEIEVDNKDNETSFTLENTDDGVIVTGLTAGQTLRVYNVAGSLVHFYKITSEEQHFVRLGTHGVYIFTSGKKSEKFRH